MYWSYVAGTDFFPISPIKYIMVASLALVSALVESKWSVHIKKTDTKKIDQQVIVVRSAIAAIISIIKAWTGTYEDLHTHLWEISAFFRESKFESITIPVLKILQWESESQWKTAKFKNTQESLLPQSFENLPKSKAEVKYSSWEIEVAQVSRENHLLSVYLGAHISGLKADKKIDNDDSVDTIMSIILLKTLKNLSPRILP